MTTKSKRLVLWGAIWAILFVPLGILNPTIDSLAELFTASVGGVVFPLTARRLVETVFQGDKNERK